MVTEGTGSTGADEIQRLGERALFRFRRGVSMARERFDGRSEFEEAVSEFDRVLERRPDHLIARMNRGCALVRLGEALGVAKPEGRSRLESAVEDFSRALARISNLAAAYVNRGSAYWLLGDAPRAMRDWRLALALQPELREHLPSLEHPISTCAA